MAKRIGAEGLEFRAGTIESCLAEPWDILIALHACNRATDDAILKGVAAGAQLILLSPCCHQELRPQLRDPAVLAPLMSHGILKERLAEWLTDGLRALYLEAAGYRSQVFEFIDAAFVVPVTEPALLDFGCLVLRSTWFFFSAATAL